MGGLEKRVSQKRGLDDPWSSCLLNNWLSALSVLKDDMTSLPAQARGVLKPWFSLRILMLT